MLASEPALVIGDPIESSPDSGESRGCAHSVHLRGSRSEVTDGNDESTTSGLIMESVKSVAELVIHFLGAGSAVLSSGQANTSLLVGCGDDWLLVDCSGSPWSAIQQAGVSPEYVGDILLTHPHVDHMYALPSLIHSRWLSGCTSLRVWGDRQSLNVARGLVEAFELSTKAGRTFVEWNELSANSPAQMPVTSSWHRRTWPVPHGQDHSLALEIHSGETQVLYSADTSSAEAIGRIVRPGAIVIHDAGGGLIGNESHAGLLPIVEMLDSADAAAAYLVHMTPDGAAECNAYLLENGQGLTCRVEVVDQSPFAPVRIHA